jgi:hypothetical protein
MYKCTLYDTTRFKAVMAMNLSELRSKASHCESNPRMGDLLGSLIWGAKTDNIVSLGVGRYSVIYFCLSRGPLFVNTFVSLHSSFTTNSHHLIRLLVAAQRVGSRLSNQVSLFVTIECSSALD